jgi:hypothetical protein
MRTRGRHVTRVDADVRINVRTSLPTRTYTYTYVLRVDIACNRNGQRSRGRS